MQRPPSFPTPLSSRSSSLQGNPPPQSSQDAHKDAPFGALVGLFERLRNERTQDRRRKLLDGWFNHWRVEVGRDLFPVLRLILPQKDRERVTYGLKEANLAKLFVRLIPLGKNDPDAQRLLNWKKPLHGNNMTSGDFPAVLYEVYRKRCTVLEGEGTLNIKRLNRLLDDLSEGMGSQSKQFEIMRDVCERATANEVQWICRIILKDLVISVKETTVFAVFHQDAMDLFNTCSDLKKVAWTLQDPSFRLHEDGKTVQLFNAFTPMLCKRPTKTIEFTVKEMQGSEFYIEEKLDGERMQLHKRGDSYFYCSRKGKHYTYLYGKNARVGSLTPFIAKAFDERVDDIILDGEMLVWDPVSERHLPFGTLKAAALDKSKKEDKPRPCFKVFDMLYLNGESLLHKSTKCRKKNMRSCLKEVKGRIEFATEWKGKTAKDVRMRMDEVMSTRGEGLVIKHPLAKYVLNGRNSDWIKVKPEYMDGMGETVDVLVVAGNYGTGSRGGGVSTLICAVVDDKRTGADDGTCYSTFVRIGTGLTFADYAWIRNKPWKVRDPKNPPNWLHTASYKSHDDKGDVYLEPEDSFILKVKAAEIVTSDQYHLGYTMRFPRALSIRDDLGIEDCMTASQVLENLRSEKKRKMETTDVAHKKRKTSVKPRKVIQTTPSYQGQRLNVEIESDVFEGLTFVVMSNPKSRTQDADKKALLKSIIANGGKQAVIVVPKHEDEPEALVVVYDGSTTPSDVQSVINKEVFDIFKPSWIKDSVALGRKAPFKKKHFFYVSSSRSRELEDDQDEDMDMDNDESRSQTEDVEVKEEQKQELHADWFKAEETEPVLLDGNKSDSETEDDDSENEDVVGEAEADVEDDSDKAVKMGESEGAMEYDQDHIFKHLFFYLDSPENAVRHEMASKKKQEQQQEINQSFSELKSLIVEHGGRVVDLNDPNLTHIVFDKRDTTRRLELIKRERSRPKQRRFIVSDFFEACLDEATLLNEEDFVP